MTTNPTTLAARLRDEKQVCMNDCIEAAALIEQQQAVIDRLPKDGDGNPVIEGETYFRRGRGQVAGIVINGKASMYGPTGARGDEFGDDMPTVYATWSDCYPSVEALEAAEAARVGKE